MIRKTIAAFAIGAALTAAPALGASPAPPRVQALADVTAKWMDAQGIPVRAVPVYVDSDRVRNDSTAWRRGDSISLTPPLAASLERMTIRQSTDARIDPTDGVDLLHEFLHQFSTDEGKVESVAKDLSYAWVRHFLRRRYSDPFVSYADQVTVVRRESAEACGQSWLSRCARLWRRTNLLADNAT